MFDLQCSLRLHPPHVCKVTYMRTEVYISAKIRFNEAVFVSRTHPLGCADLQFTYKAFAHMIRPVNVLGCRSPI